MSDINPIAENSENNNHADQTAAAQERGNIIAHDIQGRTESSSKRGQDTSGSQLAPNPDLETAFAEGGSEEGPASGESAAKARGETSKAVAEAKAGIRQEETSGGNGYEQSQSITTVRQGHRLSELEKRPELQSQICSLLSAGNYIEVACGLVGISANTFHEWIRRGENRDTDRSEDTIYATFATAVKQAMDLSEANLLQIIRESAKGGQVIRTRTITKPDGTVIEEVVKAGKQWQAGAWILERSKPARWGRKLDITARLEKMTQEELAEFVLEGVLVDSDTAEDEIAEAENEEE